MIVEWGTAGRLDESDRPMVIARLDQIRADRDRPAEALTAADLGADAVHLGSVIPDQARSVVRALAGAARPIAVVVDAADGRAGGADERDRVGSRVWFVAVALDDLRGSVSRWVVDADAMSAAAAGRDVPGSLDAAAIAVEVAAYRRGVRHFLTGDVRRTRRVVDSVAAVVAAGDVGAGRAP